MTEIQEVQTLKIYVDSVVAVKPGLLRVSAYTSAVESGLTATYEIVVSDTDFTSYKDGGTVANIDVDMFMDVVTKSIQLLRNTGNLAAALNQANLEWEVSIDVQEVKEPKKNDLTLAYGDITNDTSS